MCVAPGTAPGFTLPTNDPVIVMLVNLDLPPERRRAAHCFERGFGSPDGSVRSIGKESSKNGVRHLRKAEPSREDFNCP